MSSAKRRRIKETGAFPGRKPGTRATRANSLATRSIAFETSSAGISNSNSRRQVASAIQRSFSSDNNQISADTFAGLAGTRPGLRSPVNPPKAATQRKTQVRPYTGQRLSEEARQVRVHPATRMDSIGDASDSVNSPACSSAKVEENVRAFQETGPE